MIPLRPCSITSGTAPQRVAITGVPHAIDSIITRPNGSSHSIGKSVARASWSSSTFSPWVTSPRYSIRPGRGAARRTPGSTPARPARASCRRASAAARPRSRPRPRDARPSRRSSGRGRAGSRRDAAAPGRTRSRARSGMFAIHGRSGCGLRWFIEIEISPRPRRDARDLLVDLARARRPAGRARCAPSASRTAPAITAAGRARVVADHVELARALEARERVAHLHLRAADLGARRDLVDPRELRLRARVAGREQRHVVAGVDEPVGEQRHDPLDAAVAGRRHREPHRR